MLQINQQQLNMFREHARVRFAKKMISHVVEFFPNIYLFEGEKRIEMRIYAAIDQAAMFGLVGKSEVCKFINLTFMFGDNFYNKPNMQWVSDILGSKSNDRMSNLYELVIRQLQAANK